MTVYVLTNYDINVVIGIALVDIAHRESNDSHALALTAQGQVYAWGRNQHGQLGLNHCRDSQTPVNITRFTEPVSRIACGQQFSAAVTISGGVYMWGKGTRGQCCGHVGAVSPKFVTGLFGVEIVEIKCGFSFVMALSRQGKIFTWGEGLFKKRQTKPTEVFFGANGITIQDFACGYGHAAVSISF